MATTTTNFGWDIPQSTDLVKDGATAIAALGQDIDTSMVDLKGGTTGQVLSKATNTDMDFTWVSPTTGDITGVTAGTGLSGGGTSGDVTLSLSTPVSATNGGTGVSTFTTGDILYSSASNTLSKLGIGSTGQVLTVAGGVPSWATAGGGSTYSGASLYQSSDINISNTTSTLLTWDSEQWDTDNYHSTSSNTSRITIPSGKAGKFKFNIQVRYPANSTGRRIIYLFKNGAELWSSENTPGSQNMTLGINTQVDAAVGDYFEVKTYQSSGGTLAVTEGLTYSYFQVSYLGA